MEEYSAIICGTFVEFHLRNAHFTLDEQDLELAYER